MARYFLRFRHSDTGLTPTFTFFKKASDLTNVPPPAISEVAGGSYYFDYTPTFDIIFEADGGASIPTEEVRYICDTISPKDGYIDEPISQVKDDVWNDAVNRAVGTKGDFVEHIGVDTDALGDPTLFGQLYAMQGSSFVSVSHSLKNIAIQASANGTALAVVQGALSDIQGAGFATGTDSLKVISDNVDAINLETDPSAIANAVWNEALAGHLTPGTTGDALQDAANLVIDNNAIATAVWNKDISAYVTPNLAGTALQDTVALASDITLIKAKTDNLPTNTSATLSAISSQLTRTLGLLHENSVLDSTVFDGDNNLLAARLRIYDSKINANAAAATAPSGGTTGLLATYTISADYTGGNLTKYTVVKV